MSPCEGCPFLRTCPRDGGCPYSGGVQGDSVSSDYGKGPSVRYDRGRKNPRDDGESSGGMADWIGVDKMSVSTSGAARNPLRGR